LEDKEDYSHLASGDTLETNGLVNLFQGKPDAQISIKVSKRNGDILWISTRHTMSADQLKWLRAGSALNHIRSQFNHERVQP
jgi:homoaconitase